MVQLRATSPLPVPSSPLLLPSVDRRSDIPKADMLFQKRLCLTASASRFEVGESLTAAAARQTGHTLARRVDYGFIDTLDASIRAFEGRVMTTIGEVNERVTDLATTQRQDAHKLYDKSTALEALIRAQEACITSLKAQTRALFRKLARTRDAERQDGPADAVSSSQGVANALAEYEANRSSGNGDDSHYSGSGRRTERATAYECTYTQGVADALAEYEANRSSGNGDDSHYSGSGRRTERATARECTYSDFLKCQPLNFKGTEGVIGLRKWNLYST
ncbi:hypothetical protein Tco_0390926 [Tanacetum coccineum]